MTGGKFQGEESMCKGSEVRSAWTCRKLQENMFRAEHAKHRALGDEVREAGTRSCRNLKIRSLDFIPRRSHDFIYILKI